MNASPLTYTDLEALKQRQQVAWSSGDYAVIGTTLQIVGESLAEACDLRWDEAVLDVAAGNGNATLAAARRGCVVTSTDYVGALLERGAERARAEGLEVATQVADAEALPFDDARFDAVLSTFGVMFTANHVAAAAELARVCRPGGRIGLANWTPDSLVGRMFGVIGKYAPPPSDVPPPAAWGDRKYLEHLFGGRASRIEVTPRIFTFRYRSARHFVEVFRDWYGPLHRTFTMLAPGRAEALAGELCELLDSLNRAGPESLVAPGEYLEVVIARA